MGLKAFAPSSLKDNSLEFFEFLKYDTKEFRTNHIISKNELLKSINSSPKTMHLKSKKENISKQFEDFAKKLDMALFIKNAKNEISYIKWDRIDAFTNILRLSERSDERKVRWAIYYLFTAGKQSITKNDVSDLLLDFEIKSIDKILRKIIKTESLSGLDATFDSNTLVINHDLSDKLVSHYLADAIEEPSRRSPGEFEEEVLDLLDEGSYSNQEVSQALLVDEALVSRTMGRIRAQDKIVLSSFGKRGTRYFTTNCENCPFGTTKASCRKESLSYIINSFNEDFGIELTANDFEQVETNQALLKIKRFVMNARKEKNTKLEKNLGLNLAKLLSRVVDKYMEVEFPSQKIPNVPEFKVKVTPDMAKLPLLYQLGLKKGIQGGIHLMDDILHFASRSVKKEDRIKIKKHALRETNKLLKIIGLENTEKN